VGPEDDVGFLPRGEDGRPRAVEPGLTGPGPHAAIRAGALADRHGIHSSWRAAEARSSLAMGCMQLSGEVLRLTATEFYRAGGQPKR
jgi:hypothetical protein